MKWVDSNSDYQHFLQSDPYNPWSSQRSPKLYLVKISEVGNTSMKL